MQAATSPKKGSASPQPPSVSPPSNSARKTSLPPKSNSPSAASPFSKDLTKKGKVKPREEWNDSTSFSRPVDLSLGEGKELKKAENVSVMLDGLSANTSTKPHPPKKTNGKSDDSSARKKNPRRGRKGSSDEGSSPVRTPQPPGNSRDAGSIGRRAETDRFAKALTERNAAKEALTLLVNRLFGTQFEEEKKRRAKIETKEQDDFADIVAAHSTAWDKAKAKERKNAAKKGLVLIRDQMVKEETQGRRLLSDEELGARTELENGFRQGARSITKMSKFQQQHAAERDKFFADEVKRRKQLEDDEREKAAVLQAKKKLLAAKVKEEAAAQAEQLEAAKAAWMQQHEEECEKLRQHLQDEETSKRNTVTLDEMAGWQRIHEQYSNAMGSIESYLAMRRRLAALEEEEAAARSDTVTKEEQAAFDKLKQEERTSLANAKQVTEDRLTAEKDAREAVEREEQKAREGAIVSTEHSEFESIFASAGAAKAALLGAEAEQIQQLADERRAVEKEEETGRKDLQNESQETFESTILVAESASKKQIEASQRQKASAAADNLSKCEAEEATARSSAIEVAEAAGRADVAARLKQFVEMAQSQANDRIEVEDDEEGARDTTQTEEERAIEQILNAAEQALKLAKDAEVRRVAEEKSKDSSLAAQLEAAADTELQQAMLNNKRQERTEKLKQERAGGASGEEDTVSKSALEVLLEQWVHPLVDLYLKIDDLASRKESTDASTSEYNSMKIKFAMQLSQFKRSNPVKAVKANPNAAASGAVLTQAEQDDLHRRKRATKLVRPFFELLVRDKDANRQNVTLMSTLLTDNLPVDFATIIREDNLLADAAVDGSVSYFDTFLGVPGLNVAPPKAAELMTMALTNPIKRIQFAETIMRREHALGTMALKQDMAPFWKRLLYQVGGSADLPKDIAGLDRRTTVLSQMFTRPQTVVLDVAAPVSDKVSPLRDTLVTRLAAIGDTDMLQLLLKSCEAQPFGDSLITPRPSDQATPLIVAIESNQLRFVEFLLQFPHVRKTIRHQASQRGTAYSIASDDTCDYNIAKMVMTCGDGGNAPELGDSLAMTAGGQGHLRDIQQRFANFSPSATISIAEEVADSASLNNTTSNPKGDVKRKGSKKNLVGGDRSRGMSPTGGLEAEWAVDGISLGGGGSEIGLSPVTEPLKKPPTEAKSGGLAPGGLTVSAQPSDGMSLGDDLGYESHSPLDSPLDTSPGTSLTRGPHSTAPNVTSNTYTAPATMESTMPMGANFFAGMPQGMNFTTTSTSTTTTTTTTTTTNNNGNGKQTTTTTTTNGKSAAPQGGQSPDDEAWKINDDELDGLGNLSDMEEEL